MIHGFGLSGSLDVYFGQKKCLKLVPHSAYPFNKLLCTVPPMETGTGLGDGSVL